MISDAPLPAGAPGKIKVRQVWGSAIWQARAYGLQEVNGKFKQLHLAVTQYMT